MATCTTGTCGVTFEEDIDDVDADVDIDEVPADDNGSVDLGDQILKYFNSVDSSIVFDKIESNNHGVFVLEGHRADIKEGKKQATVVCFLYPVAFFPDALKLGAKFRADRGGVNIKVPSMPTPLYNQHAKVLQAMACAFDPVDCPEALKTPICLSTEKTYKTEATRIASSERNKFKIIQLNFPKGVTCNNRDFNNDASEGDQTLVTRIASMTATDPAFKDSHGNLLEFPFSFGFWKCVQDGTEQQAVTPPKSDKTGAITKMMSALHVKANNDAMDVDGRTDSRAQHVAEALRLEEEKLKTLRAEKDALLRANERTKRLQNELLRQQQEAEARAEAQRQSIEKSHRQQQAEAEALRQQLAAESARAEAQRRASEELQRQQQAEAETLRQQLATQAQEAEAQRRAAEATLRQQLATEAQEAEAKQRRAAEEWQRQQQAEAEALRQQLAAQAAQVETQRRAAEEAYRQQQAAGAASQQQQAEAARVEANRILEEADRAEKLKTKKRQDQRAAAAAATASASLPRRRSTRKKKTDTSQAIVAVGDIVAYHEGTGYTEADVDEMIAEAAENHGSSEQEVIDYIAQQNLSPQDFVDMFFKGLTKE